MLIKWFLIKKACKEYVDMHCWELSLTFMFVFISFDCCTIIRFIFRKHIKRLLTVKQNLVTEAANLEAQLVFHKINVVI